MLPSTSLFGSSPASPHAAHEEVGSTRLEPVGTQGAFLEYADQAVRVVDPANQPTLLARPVRVETIAVVPGTQPADARGTAHAELCGEGIDLGNQHLEQLRLGDSAKVRIVALQGYISQLVEVAEDGHLAELGHAGYEYETQVPAAPCSCPPPRSSTYSHSNTARDGLDFAINPHQPL